MKLAVLVNYEDAGNLKLVDVDSKEVRFDYCPLIDDGCCDLIKFENGKAFQAAVEHIEEEEGTEDDDGVEEDWEISWILIDQERR